jgi:hypothetical protein
LEVDKKRDDKKSLLGEDREKSHVSIESALPRLLVEHVAQGYVLNKEGAEVVQEAATD